MHHERPAAVILTPAESWSLLRLVSSTVIDAARAELIQAQRNRVLAEQAARQFCAADLDREPRR